MNHLRAHKFKLSGKDNVADNNSSTTTTDNGNNNNNSGGKGFLTRIKRYSTLGNKLSRRHLGSGSLPKGGSPPKLTTGSYNMTGSNSEDHRLEIGAPILISTTTLDTDRFGVTEARLKQIGGGIAVNSTIVRTMTPAQSAQNSPQPRSSGSEHEEEFVDALSTTQEEREKERERERLEQQAEASEQFETPAHKPPNTPPPTPPTTLPPIDTLDGSVTQLLVTAPARRPRFGKQQQSQSVQNLHRSELKVYLHKTPSMAAVNMNATAPELGLNLPDLPELFGNSLASLAASDNKENATPTPQLDSLETTTKVTGFLAQQAHFRSIDFDDLPLPAISATESDSHRLGQRYSARYSSQASSIAHRSAHDSKQSLNSCRSLSSHGSAIDDFDLKSVSYQSLNAQNLFVSIDELNEITRQINETEDFSREIDLEYCTHRDQLKPSERRITLLKNKNSRLISFNHNKEKLRKGWHGMKHWIGEESTRLKEVVKQQTPLKRIAQSRLNLNQSLTTSARITDQQSERQSLSPARVTSQERELSESFEDVTEHTENTEAEARDELESSLSQRGNSEEDLSPHAKRFKDEGQNGFEELRRYVKQGGDFSKELILVLQERADSELIYSKSLSKMANKLNKACRELPGSVADAWRGVATEMESRSDIHRQLAASLTDELVKPLKTIVDSHHKSRKAVEGNVDKASRVLSEWRVSEAKAKKASHTAARENEKLQDAMLDVRIQKSPSIALLHQGPNKLAAEKELKSAEKDCVKLDNKRKKAEEAVKRADVEYYTLCVRAERARVDWEMAVLRGSAQLQNSEQQRLASMQNFVQQYARLTADMSPILGGLVNALQPQLEACNVAKDMLVVRNIRRNSEGPSEQLLPDFYCEHTTLAMNRERRKHALIKLLQLVKTDLERERRSRDGLRGLSQSLNQQEHQNITDKLYHIRSMLTYLEGARLKLHSALLELDHKPRTTHPLAQHIQITRDRNGLQQSILKVPNWLKNNDKTQASSMLDNGDVSLHDDPQFNNNNNNNNNNNSSCANISEASGAQNPMQIQQQTLNQNQNQQQSSLLLKHFNRSKSNIETFTSQPKIISTTNTSLATASNIHASKSKTVPAMSHSDRGQGDGGSNQQDSDFDEFSSEDEDEDEEDAPQTHPQLHPQQQQQSPLQSQPQHLAVQPQNYYQNAQDLQNASICSQGTSGTGTSAHSKDSGSSNGGQVLGRCKALYSYTPKLYDELQLQPGDVIEVHAKQDDGWWLGALRNQIGIFPATYVEECA
ncbi:uncharacterized protein LOC115627174 isoform X1 [Scaptodrosophila lebanonensis]|uniref:Uncharacterized protein LOC115627174 isoform X1 n=1 Tax=Drosophila lebanonensis TaxID=7225 RepID=A0A6J2TPP8_DROLE|nr:uncharacterized protein LOC115627174 isoform X1 [Scaptodrosophila lebanonensis]XP_030378631.1 uncharacterized protein LOC115627174 isoform X1 [Scaptodrosophila lebanonensis]